MRTPLVFVTLALAALAACSDSHNRAPGSQTHFLQSCDDSCAAPYQCICGVCTVQCSKDAQCSTHASGAECTAAQPSADLQCNADAPVCDVMCNGDGDCAALGDAFACSGGRCRALPMSIDTGMHDSGTGMGKDASTGKTDSGTPPDAAVVVLDGGHMQVDSGPSDIDAGPIIPICNGGKGYRLGVFDSGTGLLAPNPSGLFIQIFGGPFMVIGSDCQFYASANPMKGIVTGTLSTGDAAQLASDVDWSMFTEFGKYAKSAPLCQDGGGYITGDGIHSFACLCDCDPAAPPSLARAKDAAARWLTQLADDGMGVNGPVSAVATVFSGGTPPPGDPQVWPLLTPITDIVSASEDDLGDGMRFDDPGDAMMLRAMRSKALADFADARQIYVTDGTQEYLMYLRDELDSATSTEIASFRMSVLSSSP